MSCDVRFTKVCTQAPNAIHPGTWVHNVIYMPACASRSATSPATPHLLVTLCHHGLHCCRSVQLPASAEEQFFELPQADALCCGAQPCKETPMCQELGTPCNTTHSVHNQNEPCKLPASELLIPVVVHHVTQAAAVDQQVTQQAVADQLQLVNQALSGQLSGCDGLCSATRIRLVPYGCSPPLQACLPTVHVRPCPCALCTVHCGRPALAKADHHGGSS